MISFTVRMRFEEADHDTVAGILRQLGPASRQEPGCVNYIAHFVDGDSTTVVIYEQYLDEAALDHHRNAPHFKQFAAGGLYQLMREREIEILNLVS